MTEDLRGGKACLASTVGGRYHTLKCVVSFRLRLPPLPVALLAVVVLLAAACSTGTYKRDIFPEMHYQQSYRSQEPPRLLPPEGSVPITGRELVYDFGQASELKNPVPPGAGAARELYRVNCAMCHGPEGRGDGPLAQHFEKAGVSPPVDLAGERVKARNEGQLFWVLTNGLGNMPAFGRLITAGDRWQLVGFVQSVGRR